jgi:hypothetical protein
VFFWLLRRPFFVSNRRSSSFRCPMARFQVSSLISPASSPSATSAISLPDIECRHPVPARTLSRIQPITLESDGAFPPLRGVAGSKNSRKRCLSRIWEASKAIASSTGSESRPSAEKRGRLVQEFRDCL